MPAESSQCPWLLCPAGDRNRRGGMIDNGWVDTARLPATAFFVNELHTGGHTLQCFGQHT